MPEPTTFALAALGAFVGKDAISKILGPTYNYLGEELLAFAKKRIGNTGKIFSNAEKKLGDKLDRPGQVPPKVLKTIINEGSYADDAVATEYFGGVLASSRTEIERDDRGARLAKAIDSMSAYQLRSHYLIYSTISELFSNSEHSFNLPSNRAKMQIFMPLQDYDNAMDFTQQEWHAGDILHHTFYGLNVEGLIENTWRFGSTANLRGLASGVSGPGIICAPSVLGAELLLWAFGHGDKILEFLLTDEFSPEIEGIPKSVSNAVPTKDMTNKSR